MPRWFRRYRRGQDEDTALAGSESDTRYETIPALTTTDRLVGLADDFARGWRGDVRQAIALATDLLVEGSETPATVEVASASLTHPPSAFDVGPTVVAMLDEQGVEPPPEAARGWGVVLVNVPRLLSASPEDRSFASHQIIWAFEDDKPATVWELAFLSDLSAGLSDEVERIRPRESSGYWTPSDEAYRIVAVKLNREARQQLSGQT